MTPSVRKVLRITVGSAAAVVLAAMVLLYRPDIPVETLRESYADTVSRFVDLEGMQVHYKDEGSGLPLLLLHGTAASLHTWDGWTSELDDDFRIVRLDFPGFGLTGPDPSGDYSIERRVELTAKFLDLLAIERCSLAGNSLGGYIAWQVAARRPERVEKLILVDPAGYHSEQRRGTVFDLGRIPVLRHVIARLTPRSLVRMGLVQSYGDPSKITPDLVERYYRLLRREGNRQALMGSLSQERSADEGRIRTIRQPTLVIWGSEDRLIPVEHSERFHRDLPDSRLIVYDGIGHVPMEEIPERSAADAREFLLTSEAGSAGVSPASEPQM